MKPKLLTFVTLIILITCSFSIAQVPTLVNYPFVKGDYQSVEKDGNTLFCLTDYGLMIWDITDINNPSLISKLPSQDYGYSGKLKQYGNYLFILRIDTIIIVDKSNLLSPTFIPFNSGMPNYNFDMEIKDSILFLSTQGLGSGVFAFNIADIYNPVLLSTLSLPSVNETSISDTLLFARCQNSFYRININNGIMIKVDSIVAGVNQVINDAIANSNTVIIGLGDMMNFNNPVVNYIYDFSTPGNPVIVDSTTIPPLGYTLFSGISDSLLFVYFNLYIRVYNITNLNNITQTDSIFTDIYVHKILLKDNYVFIMKSGYGFDVHHQDSPFSFSLAKHNNVGAYITDLQLSSTGYVFAYSLDSVYVFDKNRTTSEIVGDYAYVQQSYQQRINDSLMFDARLDAQDEIRMSSISNFPNVDSLYTFYDNGPTDLIYFDIYGTKLYSYVNNAGTEIYELANPSSPVLLSTGNQVQYHGMYNNILYNFYNSTISLYDANTSPPVLLKQISLPPPVNNGYRIWDKQRPLIHCVASGAFYFELDLSDTSNIHYTNYVTDPDYTFGYSLSVVHDSILFTSTTGGGLYVYDVTDIYHFRKISEIVNKGFIYDMVLADSILFVSYGGYVATYNINNIVPGLILTSVNENYESNYITGISPNPFTGNICVTIPKRVEKTGNITITNTIGVTEFHSSIQNKHEGEKINLDLTTLSKGFYILTFEIDGEIFTRKIVKE